MLNKYLAVRVEPLFYNEKRLYPTSSKRSPYAMWTLANTVNYSDMTSMKVSR